MKRILILLLLVSAVSCTKQKDTLNLDANVDILSFEINGVQATIDNVNATVTLFLPYGTDLSMLQPTITVAEGSSIVPASGEWVDFSTSFMPNQEVVYTVTGGDVYMKYKVVVDEWKAKITSFRIGEVKAFEINEQTKTIDIYLPAGTNVTALVPIIEYTDGAEITPAPGQAVDFTDPVIYTLNYEGSVFKYTVTVHLGDEPVYPVLVYDGDQSLPYLFEGLAVADFNPFTTNPLKDSAGSINTSQYCASFTRTPVNGDNGGQFHSGAVTWNSLNVDPKRYGSITVKILKPFAGNVQIEIQNAGEQDKNFLSANYTNVGEWQELTFLIPPGRTAPIKTLLIAPHAVGTADFEAAKVYWDDIVIVPK